jgi:two-component system, chemotaxis family, sensor histidine kinase and response regulator WspE
MSELNLLAIFKEEVDGHIQHAIAQTLLLEKSQQRAPVLEELMRSFHTVKGASRAVQFEEIKQASHLAEDVFHALLNDDCQYEPIVVDLSLYALDLIEAMLAARLAKEAIVPYDYLEQIVEAFMAGQLDSVKKLANESESTQVQTDIVDSSAKANDKASAQDSESIDSDGADTSGQHEMQNVPEALAVDRDASSEPVVDISSNQNDFHRVTVAQSILDKLLNLTGELNVSVNASAQVYNSSHVLKTVLNQSEQTLRIVSQEIETSSGDQEIIESNIEQLKYQLKKQQEAISRISEQFEIQDARFNYLANALSETVTKARLIPMKSITGKYPRLVRDLAHELNKSVEIDIIGDDVLIDQAVIEHLRAPMMHLIRNAIDHGIENAAHRKANNKPSVGRIKLFINRVGANITVVLRDDGGGVCLDKIKEKVLAKQLTTEALWEDMQLHEKYQFIYLPGFSTEDKITNTSGRGFGMDIVKSKVENIGGALALVSEPNEYTEVTLQVPLTLSLNRCIFVIAGKHPLFNEQNYAISLDDVEAVYRVTAQDKRSIDGKDALSIDGKVIPCVQLWQVLGLSPIQRDITNKHAILISDGLERYALVVESIVEEQDTVSMPIEDRLGKLRDVQGMTLMNDGTLSLILDVKDIINHITQLTDLPAYTAEDEESETATLHRILVVEDSITVREVEKHFLEQAGYLVETAKDGKDGLNKAKANQFDLIISDIDMPRMNGIDMIKQIRSVHRLENIPIIVVSYKDREEDRTKAINAGANEYVTKSEFDSIEMLETIRGLLPRSE